MAGTTYVILSLSAEGAWVELGEMQGSNDLAAIKQFLAASDGEYGPGAYRAVPRRSWPKEPHLLKPTVKWV